MSLKSPFCNGHTVANEINSVFKQNSGLSCPKGYNDIGCLELPNAVGIAYWDNHTISLAGDFEKMSSFPESPECSR